MKRVATRSKPNADAVASAWLAAAYLFPDESVEVVFVQRPRAGQPPPDADCDVNVARVHDPGRLVFDHKPPAFADRNATRTTRLDSEHLLLLGRPVCHLEALVRVVHEGDRARREGRRRNWPRADPRGSSTNSSRRGRGAAATTKSTGS